MARVKRGVVTHARHKKILSKAKGYYGRRKNTIRTAIAAVNRAMQYSTIHRRTRKRDFRSLWIQRINAAVREMDSGITYAAFMHGCAKAGIAIDRKVLADLAVRNPDDFHAILQQAKNALSGA